MCDVNLITIVGRLVRDPEMRSGPSGNRLAAFCLAANHWYQDKANEWRNEPAFIPCVAFGRLGDELAGAAKGNCVLVIGRLRTETWQKDGTPHSRLVLVVERTSLLRDWVRQERNCGAKAEIHTASETHDSAPF